MKCRYDFHMACVHWARAARVAWMNFFALLLSGMILCMKARDRENAISMAVTQSLERSAQSLELVCLMNCFILHFVLLEFSRL